MEADVNRIREARKGLLNGSCDGVGCRSSRIVGVSQVEVRERADCGRSLESDEAIGAMSKDSAVPAAPAAFP